MVNPDAAITLQQGVTAVLLEMSGESLSYDPNESKFRAVVYFINKALRLNAIDHEWSYYSSTEQIATANEGDKTYYLPATVRPRLIGDDALRLTDADGVPKIWAYALPRDALSKYANRPALWYSVTKNSVELSRPISAAEDGMGVQVPVMREPIMHRLPDLPTDPNDPLPTITSAMLDQPIDFDFPEVIIARAAALYAASDPLYQPRVPMLQQAATNLMYNLTERDLRHTDSPFLNEFQVPIASGPHESSIWGDYTHPHADERGY